MHFLDRTEASRVVRSWRKSLGDRPKPKALLYYASGRASYAADASEIVTSLKAYSQATLVFELAITGDGYAGTNQPDPRWKAYRRWRSSVGETRRLYDAPGHVFAAEDRESLLWVMDLALQIGWDTWLAATPGRHLAFLSHDDRIELYSGLEARVLAKRLLALGHWTMPR